MRRSYKFWMRPTPMQKLRLEQSLETHRRVYNKALEQRKKVYRRRRETLRQNDQYRKNTGLFWRLRKIDEDNLKSGKPGKHWLAQISAVSMRDTIKRLDKAFDAFFRRLREGGKPGYPRFKGRDRFASIPFDNYNSGCCLLDSNKKVVHGDMKPGDYHSYKIKMFGVGSVRVKIHRAIIGKIKTVTIKKEAERWFAVFSCDLGEVAVPRNDGSPIGIDVGLEKFTCDSDGNEVSNPRYLKKNLQKIKNLSRLIALRDGKKKKRRDYCKRDSRRRKRFKVKLRRLHARVANLRREHHHKTALNLVRKHRLIAVEDLNIRGMLRSRRYSRSIADAGWYGFLQILSYKAESAGSQVVRVDPRGTTQQCSNCGRTPEEPLTEGDRWYTCSHCGLSLDRDHNAARNILHRALRLARTEPAGANEAPLGLEISKPKSKRSLKTTDTTQLDLRHPREVGKNRDRSQSDT